MSWLAEHTRLGIDLTREPKVDTAASSPCAPRQSTSFRVAYTCAL